LPQIETLPFKSPQLAQIGVDAALEFDRIEGQVELAKLVFGRLVNVG
jgi:hypothetical protein